MGSRNFQRPLGVLDKIASQPHTITPSGRPGIGYRDDRRAVSARLGGPSREGVSGRATDPSSWPLRSTLVCEPSPELQGQGTQRESQKGVGRP